MSSIFGSNPPKMVYQNDETDQAFTANVISNEVEPTSTPPTVVDDDIVTFSTTGVLPAPLDSGTGYYVINRDTNSFQVAATSGGSAVNITDTGSGTHYYTAKHEILLDYLNITRDESVPDEIVHQSEVTGDRVFVRNKQHWITRLVINLWKYSDPTSKFREIFHYLGKDVSFYRFRDGDPIQDESGNDVLFRVVQVQPFHLDDTRTKDQLLITLQSKSWVNISDGGAIDIQSNEIYVE